MRIKAQISFFMVMGAVALLVIGIALFTRSQLSRVDSPKTGDYSNIYNSVDECVKSALFYSAYTVGTNGGYLYPQQAYSTPFGNISIAMIGGNNTLPSPDALRAEITILMNELIPICANDIFSKYQQYEITTEAPTTELILSKSSIDAKVEYKVKIKEENKETELSGFSVSQPIRLAYLLGTSNEIVERIIANSGKIDMNHLNSLDLKIKIAPYYDKKLFILIDGKSSVKSYPFLFMFIV